MEISRDAGSIPAASTHGHFAIRRKVAFLLHLCRFHLAAIPPRFVRWVLFSGVFGCLSCGHWVPFLVCS